MNVEMKGTEDIHGFFDQPFLIGTSDWGTPSLV